MATLSEDITTQSEWVAKAFAADKLKLDYTIRSLIEIDKFFNRHSINGTAVKGGRLTKNPGAIIFSLGAYVGQTIIKNIPGAVWLTDDNDPQGEMNASVRLPDGTIIFPMQRIINRFQNGSEDAVYVYGHNVTKDYINEPFDQTFWITSSEPNIPVKPWWKFW